MAEQAIKSPSEDIGALAGSVLESYERVCDIEYHTAQIRDILHQLFPTRRLVLSQFTLFNQIGVLRRSGETYRRGRRCYILSDVLPLACIIALKEEGIPLKNIEIVPSLIQEHAQQIFLLGRGCRLNGFAGVIALDLIDEQILPQGVSPVDALLNSEEDTGVFWSFDVGELAERLCLIADPTVNYLPENYSPKNYSPEVLRQQEQIAA